MKMDYSMQAWGEAKLGIAVEMWHETNRPRTWQNGDHDDDEEEEDDYCSNTKGGDFQAGTDVKLLNLWRQDKDNVKIIQLTSN